MTQKGKNHEGIQFLKMSNNYAHDPAKPYEPPICNMGSCLPKLSSLIKYDSLKMIVVLMNLMHKEMVHYPH